MNPLGVARIPHPTKTIFDRYNAELWAIAKRIGRGYVSSLNETVRKSEVELKKIHWELTKLQDSLNIDFSRELL